MSRDELVLSFVFLMCLVCTGHGQPHGSGCHVDRDARGLHHAHRRRLIWKDILAEKGAWDAMFWMGG